MTATIRPYGPRDLDALYDVCVRTADSGDDLTGAIEDRSLPGHLFAAPYGVLEPKSAFVVDDHEGVGGYVVGTSDTAKFETRLEAEWFPAMRARYPDGSGAGDQDKLFVALIHHPVRQDPAIVADFPAHLHIDLLPRLQGQGLGRRLIEMFCVEMHRRGAAGVHLGVNPRNDRALAFYSHVGFDELAKNSVTVLLGRRFRQ